MKTSWNQLIWYRWVAGVDTRCWFLPSRDLAINFYDADWVIIGWAFNSQVRPGTHRGWPLVSYKSCWKTFFSLSFFPRRKERKKEGVSETERKKGPKVGEEERLISPPPDLFSEPHRSSFIIAMDGRENSREMETRTPRAASHLRKTKGIPPRIGFFPSKTACLLPPIKTNKDH